MHNFESVISALQLPHDRFANLDIEFLFDQARQSCALSPSPGRVGEQRVSGAVNKQNSKHSNPAIQRSHGGRKRIQRKASTRASFSNEICFGVDRFLSVL